MSYLLEYREAIRKGEIIAGQEMIMELDNLIEDLDNPEYLYDTKKAELYMFFIENCVKLTKSPFYGVPMKLMLWQKALIQAAFGFIDKDTELRKYKKVLFFVARKNGKSTLDSGLSLYMLTKDGEGGSEVYSVATKREQAKIVWEEAKRMIKKSRGDMLIKIYLFVVFIFILSLSFRNIHKRFFFALQVFREVVNQTPIEVLVHVAEAVALLRKHEHIEALAGTDEGIDYTHGVTRMHVVVDVTVDEQQVTLQVLRNLRIGRNLIHEGSVALFSNLFLHTMVSFAPPAVVDVVVVVTCA